MATEKIILDIEVSEKALTDKLKAVKAEIISLTDQEKALKKQRDAGIISQQDYEKAAADLQVEISKLKTQQTELNKEVKTATTFNEAAEGSYEQLKAAADILEKQLKKLEGTIQQNEDGTLQLTDEYVKQADTLEKLKSKIIEFDLGIKNGKTSVGLYGDAVKDANKELIDFLKKQEETKKKNEEAQKGFKESINNFSLLGVSLGNAREGTANFFSTLKANPLLLVAAGVIALVKGVQELFEKFKNTEEGGAAVAEVVAKVSSLFNAFFSVIKPVFKFLIEGVNLVLDGFTSLVDGAKGLFGIKSNLDENAKAAAKYAKMLKDAAKEQRELTVENARNKKEQEALKNIRDVETNSLQDRIAANEKLGKLELERVNKTLAIERKKLASLEGTIKLQGQSNASEEQLNELAEQRAKVYEAEEESLGRQNEQLTNRVALEKEIVELRSSIKNLELEQAILQGKITEGSREELKARTELIQENLAFQLKQYEGNADKQKEISLTAQNQILSLEKTFNEKQAANAKEARQKANEETEKFNANRIESEKLRLENELLQTKTGTEEEYQARLQILAFNYNVEREQFVKQKKETVELDLKFQLDRAKLEQDFDNQRLIQKTQNLLQQRQLELENQDLTATQKLEKQRALIQAETELKILQLADDDARDEQRRLILEERKIKEKELEIEEYNLSLEEKDARLAFELERENLQYDERLMLELAYEENRKQILLTQRGLTSEQIEQITARSEAKQLKLKQDNDKRKLESENALASARIGAANAVFDTLQEVAKGDEDLARTVFELKKGFAIAEVIQNGIAEIQGIAKANSIYPEPAATTIRIAKSIAAGVRTAGAVVKIASQKFADGGLLVGPSHSQGGIKGTGRFGNIEVEGEEFIMNKVSTKKYYPQLVAMNNNKFADGGLLPSGIDTELNSLQKTKFPPIYLAFKDFNEANNIYTETQDVGIL